MGLSKLEIVINHVQSLSNTPAQTPGELKAVFDQAGEEIKTFINSTLTTELDTLLAGKQSVVFGVDSTKIGYLSGVTSSVQTQLDDKQTQLNNKQKTITSGTAAPSGGSNGDIYLRY